MKLGDIWDSYSDYTRESSKIYRNLAIIATAICWFFRSPEIIFPVAIYCALISVVFFFICDMLHYKIGAEDRKKWLDQKEAELRSQGIRSTQNTEVEQPKELDKRSRRFFLLKEKYLVLTYVFIFIHVVIYSIILTIQ